MTELRGLAVRRWFMFLLISIASVLQTATSFNQCSPCKVMQHHSGSSFALSSTLSSNTDSDLPSTDSPTVEPPVKKWFRRPVSTSTKTINDIWAGISADERHSTVLAEAVQTARGKATERADIRPVNPIDEQTRYEAYSRLRQRMFELVRGEKCESRRGWVRSFERWQYLSKNYEWSTDSTKTITDLASLDPLLPSISNNNPAELNLFEDLSKLDGMSVEGAKRVSIRIQGDSAALSIALYKRMLLRIKKENKEQESRSTSVTTDTSGDASGDDLVVDSGNKENKGNKESNEDLRYDSAYPVRVISNQYNGDLKVSLEGDVSTNSYSQQFRVFTVSAPHAEKLRLMWNNGRSSGEELCDSRYNLVPTVSAGADTNAAAATTTTTTTASSTAATAAAAAAAAAVISSVNHTEGKNDAKLISNGKFDNDLFCVLARYAVLEGYGWQAAVAQPVVAALQKSFGVSVECFSSPLNSYLPSYCSLFPDTDSVFGSLGSFFDFNPKEGSFEANPPFVASLMVQMVLRMEYLLSEATGPMSFAVVVPAWMEDAHWPALVSSINNKGYFIISASDHSYCDGRQHDNSIDERYRPAPFDTAVFLLQNKEGADKWPLTAESEGELRAAFAAAKPSDDTLKSQESRGIYVPKFKAKREKEEEERKEREGKEEKELELNQESKELK